MTAAGASVGVKGAAVGCRAGTRGRPSVTRAGAEAVAPDEAVDPPCPGRMGQARRPLRGATAGNASAIGPGGRHRNDGRRSPDVRAGSVDPDGHGLPDRATPSAFRRMTTGGVTMAIRRRRRVPCASIPVRRAGRDGGPPRSRRAGRRAPEAAPPSRGPGATVLVHGRRRHPRPGLASPRSARRSGHAGWAPLVPSAERCTRRWRGCGGPSWPVAQSIRWHAPAPRSRPSARWSATTATALSWGRRSRRSPRGSRSSATPPSGPRVRPR